MNQSLFNVESILRTLTEVEKNKLRALPSQTLQQWQRATVYVEEMRPIFGAPGVKDVEWWGFLRKECMKAINDQKVSSAISAGTIMQSAWQGKIDLSIVDKPQGPSELVIKNQDQEIQTGVGPILALTEVARCLQRPLFLAASFSSESEKRGLKFNAEPKLSERMVNVSIPDVSTIVAAISKAERNAGMEDENLSGVKLIDKMAKAMSATSKMDQLTLSSLTATKVLKDCSLDVAKMQSIKQVTNIPMKSLEAQEKPHLLQIKTPDERILHSWTGNKIVNLKFSVPINPEKGDGKLGASLAWIELATSLLGGSSIKALASSAGLCPGLEKNESDIIRFVTVAMKAYEIHGSITVWGTSPMMPLLFFSLLEWEMSKGMSQMDAKSKIKLKVNYVQGGMKSTVVSEPSTYFTYTDRAVGFVVAWFPKETASAGDSIKTLDAHQKKYSIWHQFVGKNKFAIFREVLEQDFNIFRDGIPSLFNYWQTTEDSLSAMTFKAGKYGEEPLVRVQDVYLTSFEFVRKLLVLPFCPPVVRSYRILAVKGSKKLKIREGEDDGLVVSSDFGMVDLNDGIDGYNEKMEEIKIYEGEDAPSKPYELGEKEGEKEVKLPVEKSKQEKFKQESAPKGVAPQSASKAKEKEETQVAPGLFDTDDISSVLFNESEI